MGVVYAKNDTEMSWRSDWVQTVMKTRLANYVTDCTNAIYAKNEIELSWLIEPGLISDKNQTR